MLKAAAAQTVLAKNLVLLIGCLNMGAAAPIKKQPRE